MEANEREGSGKVSWLIDSATTSTSPQVDPRLLKAIKSLARYSDSEIRLAFDTLMEKMENNHSQIRYLTLLIIDELFMRSKLFRSLLVVNFDQFLSLCVGFRSTLPLPPPLDIATRLRSKAIEFLEKWNFSFGIHYRQLRLGVDYLKNILNLQFPNIQQNAARREQERREREMRSKEILLNKFETLRQNLSSLKDGIQRTIDEMVECLDILRPKKDGLIPLDPAEDFDEYRSSSLQKIRLESLKEGEKLRENSENKVVFDALRELYKLVVSTHLVSVQDWLSVLIKVEPEDTRFRDSTLKEFIDLRNNLQSIKSRCEQSGCTLTNTTNDEDENIWEEVEIEAVDSEILIAPNNPSKGHASTSNAPNNLSKGHASTSSAPNYPNRGHFSTSSTPYNPSRGHASTSTAHEESNRISCKTTKPSGSKKLDEKRNGSGSTCLKRSLLAEAPVMTWGSFLDDWGAKRDFLANQRGLELEGHWGRVDYDAVIPADKISELNVQATLYKEDHVEIRPCHAPLKNGGLCPRKDMRVCPFHGLIVPRDSNGNPTSQNISTDNKTPNLTTEVLEELAKHAVKNVRERDRDEAGGKIYERQAKRAKLAKVREHNESVLREAAIASTSYSENVGAAIRNVPSHKENKKALMSMLRKKITPKDRIAKRLLNSGASTVPLMTGEDTKYREAYPNQW